MRLLLFGLLGVASWLSKPSTRRRQVITRLSFAEPSPRSSWDKGIVPADYTSAFRLLEECVYEGIVDASSNGQLLAVDMLLPGLNPKLEQKAILRTEYLFKLVASLMPILSSQFSETLLAFQSIGDAAGFQKYAFQTNTAIPASIVVGDVSTERVTQNTECVLFIASKNHVGDPVLKTIQSIVTSRPDLIGIFLNCDLSDKVTTGMTTRSERDAFRSRIRPLFHLRNIVTIARPSLTPIEVGALTYTKKAGWRIFAVNQDDIVGPGSLNRFCDQPVFARQPDDPTALNPPGFILCGEYGASQPKRDDIDAAMSRADGMAARYAQAEATRLSQRRGLGAIVTVQEASAMLIDSANTQAEPAVRLLDAAVLLMGALKSTPVAVSASAVAAAAVSASASYSPVQAVVSLLDDGKNPTPSLTPPTSTASALTLGTLGQGRGQGAGMSALLGRLSSRGRWERRCVMFEDPATGEASAKWGGAVGCEWGFKQDEDGVCFINMSLKAGPLTVGKAVATVELDPASSGATTMRVRFEARDGLAAGGFWLQINDDPPEKGGGFSCELLELGSEALLLAFQATAGENQTRFQLWTRRA